MKITIVIEAKTKEAFEDFVDLLHDKAMDIEDDGNEGHPDAKMLDDLADTIDKAINE